MGPLLIRNDSYSDYENRLFVNDNSFLKRFRPSQPGGRKKGRETPIESGKSIAQGIVGRAMYNRRIIV
jgi:hypothetical protein